MEINDKLKRYIETKVLPEYAKNEAAHNLEHIRYVIKRSLKFAKTVPGVDFNMVYVVAAYHDIGHYVDPGRHELISAEMMYKDERLKDFFTDEERQTIKEAIEDHRASSKHEPRSIYGKIVSTADRNNTVEACWRRSYSYNRKLHPEYSEQQVFEDCYLHLKEKFGENGYARFFFKDEEYEKFLVEIRKLLADKAGFMEAQRRYIEAHGLAEEER